MDKSDLELHKCTLTYSTAIIQSLGLYPGTK